MHKKFCQFFLRSKEFMKVEIASKLMQKQENTTYLKAITIRDPSDLHSIKEDIKKGMVLILRVTPLAQKDVEKLRQVVE